MKKFFDWLLRRDIDAPITNPHMPKTPKLTRPATDDWVNLAPEVCTQISSTGHCPYCDTSLYAGPSGGASQNLWCGNVDACNSAFNVSEVIPWGQFIGPVPPHFAAAIRSSAPGDR